MTIMTPEPVGSELTIRDQQTTFTAAQRAALAHMGVDKAPDADVAVFFHQCQRTRLDPFAKQIYMIGRKASELIDGQWQKVEKFTIQTGIDGYRTIARRVADESGDELAYDDTLWCGADGQWRDVWLGAPHELYAAKATVRRNGSPFTHVALFREYVQTTRSKNGETLPNARWQAAGANQLAKCAEAGALRKAYPQDLGGLYVDAEVEHLANETAASMTVTGGRDWYADATTATTVDQLTRIWGEAHRAHVLDEHLQAHIRARKAQLEEPPAPPVEVVDLDTGEIADAEVADAEVVGEEAPKEARPLRKVTGTRIVRAFGKLGVTADQVDAFLSVMGVPRPLAQLSEDEGVEVAGAVESMTREQLATLAREAGQS